jgi:hypothetical protein
MKKKRIKKSAEAIKPKVEQGWGILSKSVNQRFLKAGFLPNTRPQTELPKLYRFADLPSKELSDLLSIYAAWREYTDDLLLRAAVDFTTYNEEYDDIFSQNLLLTSGKNKDERHGKVHQIESVREAHQKMLEASMYHDMVSSKQESLSNSISVISREISRRGQLPR